jgi:hypothetical protein
MNNIEDSLYKVTLYENNELYPFDSLSGNEIDSIIDAIDQLYYNIEVKKQFPYMINDEEQIYGMIFNMDEKIMEKYINKKILINPPQYGVSPWGKIEVMFEKYDLKDYSDPVVELVNKIDNIKINDIKINDTENKDIPKIKKQIKCSKCGILGHNKRSCKS